MFFRRFFVLFTVEFVEILCHPIGRYLARGMKLDKYLLATKRRYSQSISMKIRRLFYWIVQNYHLHFDLREQSVAKVHWHRSLFSLDHPIAQRIDRQHRVRLTTNVNYPKMISDSFHYFSTSLFLQFLLIRMVLESIWTRKREISSRKKRGVFFLPIEIRH